MARLGFERVMLYTQHGDFVTGGEIPAFSEPPEVLLWGQRTFRFDGRAPLGLRFVEAFTTELIHDDAALREDQR